MNLRHPAEREISDASLRPAALPARSRVEQFTRCSFITSSSKSSQLQQTATDEGQLVSGKAATVASPSSIAVGVSGRYAEQGSIQTGTSAEIGTVKATGGDVTIGLQADDLTNLVGQLTQASGEQIGGALQTIQQQQGALSELAEQRVSEEKTDTKNLIYLAGAAVAALALVAFARK